MKVNNALKSLATVLFFAQSCCTTASSTDTKTFRAPKKPRIVIHKHHCKVTPYKIAIIDTGFGLDGRGHDAHLCKFGHKDFTVHAPLKLGEKDKSLDATFNTQDPVPVDFHGHGTNIAGIVDENANKAGVPYCLVILKYYDPKGPHTNNLLATVEAIKYATKLKVDYINYSGGGVDFSMTEYLAVKAFTDQGGIFVAAAGNERSDIDKNPYFPASYKLPIISVGNLNKDGTVADTSNKGKSIVRWEIGEEVKAYGISLTGTSQATATATGKLVVESENKCNEEFEHTVELIKEIQNVASRDHRADQ